MSDIDKITKANANKAASLVRCLAYDTAFNLAITGNPAFAKAILVPILGRSDFEVKSVQAKYHVQGLGGHSEEFDCLLQFDDGTLCDLEMQKSAGGMTKDRVIAYRDALGRSAIMEGEVYGARRPTMLVIINNGDIFGDKLPLYEIRPVIMQTGKVFYDKSVIYIANLKHKDASTELGKLMMDLECEVPEEMHFAPLREGLEMIQSKRGLEMMDREIENIIKEAVAQCREVYRKEDREEGRVEGGALMLVKLVRSGDITVERAAEELGISVESFKELMTAKA